jgi:hypothetical protein
VSDSYPPAPQHNSFKLPNAFWPDGSAFQYDLPPMTVIRMDTVIGEFGVGSEDEDGIYTLPRLPRNQWNGVFNGWSNWAQKFQKDWRFGAMSDENALAQLFPETYDPWMFTEYVFNGAARDSDLPTQSAQDVSIVAPPLIVPAVTRTYTVVDGAKVLDSTTPAFYNDPSTTVVPSEHEVVWELEEEWVSTASGKHYWTSELAAMSWLEPETENRDFTKFPSPESPNKRRVIKQAVEKVNSGVRLYRLPVWSESTRWGESQNIPERIVNMTAPREYVRPDGLFTGRIVPHVTIEWGIPLYDNLTKSQVGQQRVIKYDFYAEGFGSKNTRIALWDTAVSGVNGQPDAVFTYAPLPPADTSTGDQILLPKNSLEQVRLGAAPYGDGDLIHRGCQFWKGSVEGGVGKCQCTYFTQFQSQFQVQASQDEVYNADVEVPTIPVAPFLDSQEELEVVYETGSVQVNVLDAGKAVSYVKSGQQVTAIRITQANGSPAYTLRPLGSGGFVASPGSSATLHIRRWRIARPMPHKTLCAMYDGPTEAQPNVDPKQRYFAAGGKCSFYTPVGRRVVASYSMQASNGAEWANMQRNVPPGYKKAWYETGTGQSMMDMAGLGGGFGVVTGLGFAYGQNVQTPDAFTGGLPQEDFQRVSVEYVPEIVSLAGKSTYYATSDGKPHGQDPENDIRVRPASGFNMIDFKEQQPYPGVDTVFFAMVNQNNYRLTRNVMHCYNQSRCNKIINSPGSNVGWSRGRYSAVNFTNHELRMPGYPGVDGTDSQCHYGDHQCPFMRVDRRGVEYNENYKVLRLEILIPFRINGIAGFEQQSIQEAFIHPTTGKVVSVTQAQMEAGGVLAGAICVGVRPEPGTPPAAVPVLGHWQPVLTDDNGQKWRVYFYYDRPSWDPKHTQSRVSAHIVQFDDKDQPVYTKIPAALQAFALAAYGQTNKIPWNVEILDDYKEPAGNAVYPTNNAAFAGGRHPEYKDHSKRGRQIIGKDGGYTDMSFREGATPTNQFGGPGWNTAPVAGVMKRGYWTQRYGEWILDGRPIDTTGNYVPARPRMRNKPASYADRTPIDGEPRDTIVKDGAAAGDPGDWALVGHTYSNDTKAYLAFLETVWDNDLPDDPNSDEPGTKLRIIPPNPAQQWLPRERFWFQCDKCGIDFSEEEVNVMADLKYADNSPVYPLPAGTTGPTGKAAGAAACGCPRRDGGVVRMVGPYDHFMKCYSRGTVDIWAPPGTTVKHDAFFWKAPAMVTRVEHDQLLRKLGMYHATGGGYSFAGLTPSLDQLGRLPTTYARGYQPGIDRQLVAPWAGPGDTVATVRTRLTPVYGLTPADKAILQRADQSAPAIVVDEAGTTMATGDILNFWRTVEGDQGYRIGLPIGATTPAPDAVLAETLVTADEVRPVRSDFAAGYLGERQFQDRLQSWLIGVVLGSLQNWSSSIYAQKNLLADSLSARGINPDAARPIDPKTGDLIDIDERLLSPYSVSESTGLHMVTAPHMKRLRNRVLPMLAYDLTIETYKAGGDFTDRAHLGNLKRFGEQKKPFAYPKLGTIIPQVMAATETGKDSYFEWEVGDVEGTKARAYNPTGTTWWRMNQRAGQIKRSGGTNQLHLDDATKNPDGTYAWDGYTGDTITSCVTYFIHGRLPMDKEIVRAFLVYEAQDPPSYEAIGCQGQYTGFVGTRDFYDPSQINNLEYAGHSFCFWQHYHPFTTNHEGDDPRPYYGFFAYKHVTYGHSHPDWFKDHGTMTNTETPWLMSEPDDMVVFTQAFTGIDLKDYAPFVADDSDATYAKQVALLGHNYADSSLGWNVQQDALKPWAWGQPLQQNKTEYQNWKEVSYQTFGTLEDRYAVRIRAAVNTIEAVQTGSYVGADFRGLINERLRQPISGWLNMTGYDTSGMFNKYVPLVEKTSDFSPPEPQEENPHSTTATGGNGKNQAGQTKRVIDITKILQKVYNDRVDRFYTVQFGARYDDLFNLVKGRTDTNLGLISRFHQDAGDEIPWYDWNYRYMKLGAGMWLSDPFHHPPLVNGAPATGNADGDPIIQAAEDRQARVEAVTDWDKQGKSEGDPEYLRYHPFSLCRTLPAPDTFMIDPGSSGTTGSSTSVKPVPADDSSYYWRVVDDQFFPQSFAVDLLQTPYENTRRPWRYNPPSIDASNAICTNKTGCFVAQNNWTVAQFYAQATTTWGLGVIPSIHSKTCAMCHTPLPVDQIQFVDGDSILTVYYDDNFVADSLVNAVEVDVVHATWNPTVRHGFEVEYWNSQVQQWRSLFAVTYDNAQAKFVWQEWNGSAWASVSSTVLPTIFKGCEGINGNPRNTATAIGSHFTLVAAQKLRLRVNRPAVVSRLDPLLGFGACTPNPATRSVAVVNLTEVASTYVNRPITLKTATGQTFDTTITSVAGSAGNYTLTVQGEVSADHTQYQIVWKDYVSRVTKFRVYGYPYRPGEVVITPPGQVQASILTQGLDGVRLDSNPSQISRVTVLVGDSEPVTMTEVDYGNTTFVWTITQDTYDGRTYKRITAGKWYYDFDQNRVVLPTQFVDQYDGNKLKNIWDLNLELYNTATNPLPVKTLPSSLFVEYLVGLGVPVDVDAAAFGPGPSYQLEREAIRFIAGHSDNDTVNAPGPFDPMPSMGDSVRLKNNDGNRIPMKWHVYNHDPMTWQTSVAWLVGDELGAGEWDDNSMLGVFSGKRGPDMSNLGPGAALGGKAAGTVTFYGSSSTILSGQAMVYAKANTTTTYNLPTGESVTIRERTGGYRGGAFVFRLEVADVVTGKRTGISCPVPKVLVYARERNFDELI